MKKRKCAIVPEQKHKENAIDTITSLYAHSAVPNQETRHVKAVNISQRQGNITYQKPQKRNISLWR